MIKVLQVNAVSYSGTTWMNLMIDSHPNCLCTGPPEKLWNSKAYKFEGVNLVEKNEDKFWTSFGKSWNKKENFLVSLAKFANVKCIVFDNPSDHFKNEVMLHPDIKVIQVDYLRDGRGISNSFFNKNNIAYLDSIVPDGWLYHSFINRKLGDSVFRYEDVTKDPYSFLTKIGQLIDETFLPNHVNFIDFDHVITDGNSGTTSLLRMAKNKQVDLNSKFEKKYNEILKLQQKKETYFDEEWKLALNRTDLLFFDILLGKKNEEIGYSRDIFDQEEVIDLIKAYNKNNNKKIGIPLRILRNYEKENDISLIEFIQEK